MLRGVIELTNQQLNLLKSIRLDRLEDLSRRINSIDVNAKMGTLEINEDEMDHLIDALPAPSSETQCYNQLRILLTNWLRQLRES